MKKALLCLLFFSCSGTIDIQDMGAICRDVNRQLLLNNLDKNYILLAANDNLDDNDLTIFKLGLKCLGMQEKIVDEDTTIADLTIYTYVPGYFLYFTGHGSTNTIYVSSEKNNPYDLLSGTFFSAQNVFIATCETLKYPEAVRVGMNRNTDALMGYTKPSYDYEDENVVFEMLLNMHAGLSIPMSFFNANKDNSALHDRWVIYKRENGIITEYSERTGNKFYED